MKASRPLRIAFDAQLKRAECGGIAQAVLGLIHALGRLTDGSEEFTIVVDSQAELEWLTPFGGPNQRFVTKPRVRTGLGRRWAKAALAPFVPAARDFINSIIGWRRWPEVTLSDGFYESLGCDVVHFPFQRFVVCGLPAVY